MYLFQFGWWHPRFDLQRRDCGGSAGSCQLHERVPIAAFEIDIVHILTFYVLFLIQFRFENSRLPYMIGWLCLVLNIYVFN